MNKELKSLAQSSSVYIVFGFINALVPFILIPVLTRYLSPADYGIVGFIIIMTAFSSLSALGTEGAATRKYFDKNIKNNEIAEFVGACFLILGVPTVISMLILGIILTRTTSFFIELDLIWVIAALISGGCMMTLQLASGQAQVRDKPFLFGLLQLMYGVSNLSISILLVVVYKYGPEEGVCLAFL